MIYAFLNRIGRFRSDMLPFQRKYFYTLYDDLEIELTETKIQVRTTNRKKQSAIPLVDASGCFRGLRKPHHLSTNDALQPQRAKASFR